MASSTSSFSSSDDDLAIDNSLAVYIMKRKEELQNEFNLQKEVLEHNHGKLLEVEEAVFLDSIRQSEIVVCHFFHPEFNTCKVLDDILEKVASIHLKVRFIKINALGAGFFVNKLKIKTLPTLCVFDKGILKKKFLGFDEFGGDKPSVELLQMALAKTGVINYASGGQQSTSIFGHRDPDDSDSF
ncbi:ATP binding protein associated with cell differentiation, putative [Giardia lamblia P15]|uniref:ATP binding protein associated with cell differentiation, putative n=1 Tax=Giardia intestinalis (strain P15) TaxID=658858 RepID=E1F961_GIAIA|nr:ATP binding protein associated with cell differentiation, putative [Giardia lamblia P15]